jgi:voltage-gated potassium channel
VCGVDPHPAPDPPGSRAVLPGRPDGVRLLPGTLTARRRPLVLSLARTLGNVAVVLVGYYLLPLDRSFGWGTVVALGLGLLLVAALLVWQVHSILRSPHPALRAVETLALTVPLVLVLFALVYVLLDRSDPSAFSEALTRTDALYFVVTVFATVGFGDIVPVTEVARVLVTVQMLGDLVLIGLVLRVFLTAVDRGRRRAAERETGPPVDGG